MLKATAGCGVGFLRRGLSVRKHTAPVALILGRVAVLPPSYTPCAPIRCALGPRPRLFVGRAPDGGRGGPPGFVRRCVLNTHTHTHSSSTPHSHATYA